MVSQIKVNEIIKQSGSSISIGESGDTINLAGSSYSTSVAGTVSFVGKLITSNQTISDNTTTKINLNGEDFDTDNAFDTSTGKFTVPSGQAGKYFIGLSCQISSGANDNFNFGKVYMYKNGSLVAVNEDDDRTTNGRGYTAQINGIWDLSVGDYIEMYAVCDTGNGGSVTISNSQGERKTYMYGFRIA